MSRIRCLAVLVLVVVTGCALPWADRGATFGDDVAFLQKHTDVLVLSDEADMAQAIRFYRMIPGLWARAGVTVGVHPHSHHGSLLESADEYDRLLAAPVDCGLMFNPDLGHIVRGGQPLM